MRTTKKPMTSQNRVEKKFKCECLILKFLKVKDVMKNKCLYENLGHSLWFMSFYYYEDTFMETNEELLPLSVKLSDSKWRILQLERANLQVALILLFCIFVYI